VKTNGSQNFVHFCGKRKQKSKNSKDIMKRQSASKSSTGGDDFDLSYQERIDQQERANSIWDLALTLVKQQQQQDPPTDSLIQSFAFEVPSTSNNSSSSSSTTRSIPSINDAVFIRSIRQSTEVLALKSVGCSCINNDWNNVVLLFSSFANKKSTSQWTIATTDVSDLLKRHISNVVFHGIVVLIISQQVVDDDSFVQKKLSTTSRNGTLDVAIKGIHNCRVVSNSIIDLTSVSIYQCMEISHCYIYGSNLTSTIDNDFSTSAGSVTKVWNCSTVTCQQQDKQQPKEYQSVDNRTIIVGPETAGGYEIDILPESTMVDVGDQILNYTSMKQNKPIHPKHEHRKLFTIIGRGCTVQSTTTIDNVHMYSNCTIDTVHKVQNVIMMNDSAIQNGCYVQNVTMQWNTLIEINSTVTNVHIMEQSHIGPNSHINTSIIGCDVHVSNGEIHSCIIGSNTAAHHQSLLISIVWITGRGNVGYGANVGSNHTGRLPDQIITCAEGIFWGLSCIVTMPIDLSCSSYTLIAAGTHLNSGRCTMPFSLIVGNNNNGISIIPGWLLKSSPYTIERNENKYSTRRKAKRHYSYTGTKIIRYQTIHLCFLARNELQYRVDNSHSKKQMLPNIYTTYPISNESCAKGIEIYSDTIQRYALAGFYEKLLQNGLHDISNTKKKQGQRIIESLVSSLFDADSRRNKNSNLNNESNLWSSGIFHQTLVNGENISNVSWPKLPWQIVEDDDVVWSYRQFLLHHEFTNQVQDLHNRSRNKTTTTASDCSICYWLLQKYKQLEQSYTKNVISSKERDDVRGKQLIPGYNESHSNSQIDPIIQQIQQRLQIILHNIQQVQQQYLDTPTGNIGTVNTSRL
jgi:Domain of unknown function (DUF4954)